MKKNHDIIEVSVLLKHETDAAILVSEDGEKGIWIPKSKCEFSDSDVHGFVTIELPEWLALEKGLI